MLGEAVQTFGGNVAILSNSAGSKDDVFFTEAKVLEQSLCLPVIRHNSKKPMVLSEIITHFKCEEELKQEEIAIIGDRILTDVLMGNACGFLTIYVEPLDTRGDNFAVKASRLFENKLLPLVIPKDPVKHALVRDYNSLLKKF